MTNTQIWLTVVVISLVTAALRFLPFLLFGEKREASKLIKYLGKILPFAVMGMLVVYCLKDVSLLSYPYGLPELICVLLVIVLQVLKRNTLLSVGGGTIAYMLMVQLIF